ncbi:MAG TPA: hypothetical protein VI136_17230, partial [Verrucomicrobiae bacterium]
QPQLQQAIPPPRRRQLDGSRARRFRRHGISICSHGDASYSGGRVKKPDRKELGLLAALLLALAAAGCGGVNANVPISPMMFMENATPQSRPAEPAVLALASHDSHAVGP